MKTYTVTDTTGVMLSSLCVIHCLMLPLLGTLFPILGLWSEVEWVHKIMVLLALPIGLSLVLSKLHLIIRFLAALGLSLLLASAFFEPLHDHETVLTVIGAGLLGASHIFRMRQSHSPD